MNIFNVFSGAAFGRFVVTGIIGMAVVLGGCDAVSNLAQDDAALSGDLAAFEEALGTLSTHASLSSDETSSLRDLVASYGDEIDEPGTLWYLSADIHDELSREQIERLKTELQERREGTPGPGRLGPPRGPNPMGPRLHWLTEIDLSPMQKESLRAIRAAYRDSARTFREACRNGTLDDSAAERWEKLRAEMRKKIRDVLTDDQRAQVDALLDDREDRLAAIREARAEALELTNEQREQLDSLRTPLGDWGARVLARCDGEGPDQHPIASILTEEQKEIVMIHRLLLRSQRQDDKGPRGPHGPRPNPPGF